MSYYLLGAVPYQNCPLINRRYLVLVSNANKDDSNNEITKKNK